MDIHVFNLSQNIIESDLLRLFTVYGHVNSVVITRDRSSGRSTGSAFINMSNDDMASQAVLHLNQEMLDGKRIAVSEIKFSLGKYNN